MVFLLKILNNGYIDSKHTECIDVHRSEAENSIKCNLALTSSNNYKPNDRCNSEMQMEDISLAAQDITFAFHKFKRTQFVSDLWCELISQVKEHL